MSAILNMDVQRQIENDYGNWHSTDLPYYSWRRMEVGGLESGLDFRNDFWPRSSLAFGTAGVDYGPEPAISWALMPLIGGQQGRVRFVGKTKDSSGTVITSATVRLFRTSDNVLIDTVTSDAGDGSFFLTSYSYPDTHYITAYKTGAPDTEGTTVNTIIGA